MAIAVLTSGGDAPGMNAALRTVVRVAAARGVQCLGVEHGYEGLIEGRMRVLRPQDVDAAGHTGGTLLGSARSKGFMTAKGRSRAAEALSDCDGLIVIGGNGSLTGAHIFAEQTGVRVMGVPASIDNDIGCTSTAIGVDSALNTIVDACDRISDTARAHRRAFVVEVMGRHCGYLAMASAVAAGADAVLFREQGKDRETLETELLGVIRRGFAPGRDKQQVLVIKAEGVEVPTTLLVRRLQARVDAEVPGVDVRATVLGHLVRGGNPSYQDRMVSARLCNVAVQALLSGATDQMVAWQPWTDGGTPTPDPSVQLFGLERVIQETTGLLSGESPVTQRRIRMMQEVEGVLAL